MKLAESVAVVIGGASGIGKSYCESLLNKGAKVLIGDIQVGAAEETCNALASLHGGDRVVSRKCDGASESDIRDILLDAKSRWGRLDIVINHVGIVNESNWLHMLKVNLGNAVYTAKVTEEILGKNNGGPGGVMIITASRAGVIPSPFLPIYAASKAAVVHYIRSMMHPLHYNRHGIRMMCVCPGMTKTNLVHEADDRKKVGIMYDRIKEAFKMKDDTNTWVQPEWVGELLVSMLEDDKEMAGVAAVLNSKEPEFYYKGEWKNVE